MQIRQRVSKMIFYVYRFEQVGLYYVTRLFYAFVISSNVLLFESNIRYIIRNRVFVINNMKITIFFFYRVAILFHLTESALENLVIFEKL